MWDLIALINNQFESWKSTLWKDINVEELLGYIQDMDKKCKPTNASNKDIKNYRSFSALIERVKNMATMLPLISDLDSPYMKDRHWNKLMNITGKQVNHKSPNFCLDDLIVLELHKFAEDVSELVEGAQKEDKIENKLNKIQEFWDQQAFEFKEYKEVPILGSLEVIVENLETHSLDLMSMQSSKDSAEFIDRVTLWVNNLKSVEACYTIWVKVQRNWQRLEPIFLCSDDIRQSLPDETKRFEDIDRDFKQVMADAFAEPGVIVACTFEGRLDQLKGFMAEIEACEKALNEYLDQKKMKFARFYFVSDQALLDILSNGTNPEKVDEYLADCFDGMKSLQFIRGPGIPYPAKSANGMISKEGERVPFNDTFHCSGAVENYLTDLEACMQRTLKEILVAAKGTADNWGIETTRQKWLEDYNAQIALLTTQIVWTEETARAFEELEGGSETAMKDYLSVIISRIKALIERVREPNLDDTPGLRVKIITIITIDVHARDIIEMFVAKKIVDAGQFAWQSQLKFYMEKHRENPKEDKKVCIARICDWETYYNYEYVGNCGRLVITPLTDRCYITLTQALNLSMGGAPAGPAGTGKTETTKDLGRALGLQVMVWNCSD